MPQKTISEKIKEAGKHGLIYGLGSIAQSAAGFFLLPLYAKYLLPHDYGVFSLIQMIGIVLGAIFYLGASSALPRSYFNYDDPEKRKKVFNTTLLLLATGALIQILIGALFSNIISKLVIGSAEYGHLIFINLVSSAIIFINTGFFIYLRLLRKSKIVVLMSIVNLLITISVVYYFLVFRQLGIAAPIYAILVSQCITSTFFIIYLRKSISLLSYLPNELSFQFKYGFPLAIASLAQMVTDWGDRVLLNNFLTTFDVGIYSFAVRIAMIYNVLIMLPFAMIWAPMMMEYKNDQNVREMFTRITFYYTLISVILIVFTNFFIADIFGLLAKNSVYNQSIGIVPYVMMGLFLYSLCNIFTAGILFEKKSSILVYIYLGWGIINILMNIIMIKNFHIMGAVITAIITRFGISFTALLISSKYFTFPFNILRYTKISISILLVLVSKNLLAQTDLFSSEVFINIFLFAGFLVFIYYIVFDKDEKIHIQNTLMSRNTSK